MSRLRGFGGLRLAACICAALLILLVVVEWWFASVSEAAPGGGELDSPADAPAGDTVARPASGTARDWEIAREHFTWAVAQPPGTFPRFGDLLARIGDHVERAVDEGG